MIYYSSNISTSVRVRVVYALQYSSVDHPFPTVDDRFTVRCDNIYVVQEPYRTDITLQTVNMRKSRRGIQISPGKHDQDREDQIYQGWYSNTISPDISTVDREIEIGI